MSGNDKDKARKAAAMKELLAKKQGGLKSAAASSSSSAPVKNTAAMKEILEKKKVGLNSAAASSSSAAQVKQVAHGEGHMSLFSQDPKTKRYTLDPRKVNEYKLQAGSEVIGAEDKVTPSFFARALYRIDNFMKTNMKGKMLSEKTAKKIEKWVEQNQVLEVSKKGAKVINGAELQSAMQRILEEGDADDKSIASEMKRSKFWDALVNFSTAVKSGASSFANKLKSAASSAASTFSSPFAKRDSTASQTSQDSGKRSPQILRKSSDADNRFKSLQAKVAGSGLLPQVKPLNVQSNVRAGTPPASPKQQSNVRAGTPPASPKPMVSQPQRPAMGGLLGQIQAGKQLKKVQTNVPAAGMQKPVPPPRKAVVVEKQGSPKAQQSRGAPGFNPADLAGVKLNKPATNIPASPKVTQQGGPGIGGFDPAAIRAGLKPVGTNKPQSPKQSQQAPVNFGAQNLKKTTVQQPAKPQSPKQQQGTMTFGNLRKTEPAKQVTVNTNESELQAKLRKAREAAEGKNPGKKQ